MRVFGRNCTINRICKLKLKKKITIWIWTIRFFPKTKSCKCYDEEIWFSLLQWLVEASAEVDWRCWVDICCSCKAAASRALANNSCCCLKSSSSGIPRFSSRVLCLRFLAATSLHSASASSASFLNSPYPSFSKAKKILVY